MAGYPIPERRTALSLTIRAGARWPGDAEWHRACLWADYAPDLFGACSAAYIAYQRRRMEPKAMKEAIAFLEEITNRVAHEVWLGGEWALGSGAPAVARASG